MTNGKKPIEAFALSRVPREQRKSWVDMVMVQAGMVICIPAFLLGSMLAGGDADTAGDPGWYHWLWDGAGADADIGHPGGGSWDSDVRDLDVDFWAQGDAAFGELALHGVAGGIFRAAGECLRRGFFDAGLAAFGVEIPVVASSIFWGMVMVVIAVWGMETLKNLDTISVPLLLLIMIVGTVMAFRIYGSAGLSANEVETPTMTMIEGIGTAFSFFSASAFTAADLTRFQRNRRDTVRSAFWGLMPAGIITCVIGVLLSRVVGVYDISQVMAMVGLPILGLTIMILAQLTTNSVNAYTGGLDAVMTFNLPDNRRREATFVVGVLGVVLAVLGILDFIEVYLNWTTFLGAPIAGVMIADYWIVGKGKPASWHANEGWNGTGIAATLISLVIALMIPFGVFNFNGVIIGFIVYLILEHFWPSASRRLDGEYSEKKGE